MEKPSTVINAHKKPFRHAPRRRLPKTNAKKECKLRATCEDQTLVLLLYKEGKETPTSTFEVGDSDVSLPLELIILSSVESQFRTQKGGMGETECLSTLQGLTRLRFKVLNWKRNPPKLPSNH
jgi:hypothetical protein